MINFTFRGEAVSIDETQELFSHYVMAGITKWGVAQKHSTLGDSLEALMAVAVDSLGYSVLGIVAIANADFGDDSLGNKMLKTAGHPYYNISCGNKTIMYPWGDAPFSAAVNTHIYGYMATLGFDLNNIQSSDVRTTIENIMDGIVNSGAANDEWATTPSNWTDEGCVAILNYLGYTCSI